MFSEFNNLLLRDKLHTAKLRKYRNQKLSYQEKSFGHKKIISNGLANTH